MPTGLNAYSPCITIHLSVERRRLWKSCVSEVLDLETSVLLRSKYMLIQSSWRWALVLSDRTQQFSPPVQQRRLWKSHDSAGTGWSPSYYLAADTCQDVVPGGGP
jgi:hypothetical protein